MRFFFQIVVSVICVQVLAVSNHVRFFFVDLFLFYCGGS